MNGVSGRIVIREKKIGHSYYNKFYTKIERERHFKCFVLFVGDDGTDQNFTGAHVFNGDSSVDVFVYPNYIKLRKESERTNQFRWKMNARCE